MRKLSRKSELAAAFPYMRVRWLLSTRRSRTMCPCRLGLIEERRPFHGEMDRARFRP